MSKPESQDGSPTGMSYKFQRLREKIRQAVTSGEFTGKLPGERELAKRFQVNAKTLSKALTDLAGEGLLQRSIGRGTFVKGSLPAEQSQGGPWLLIVDQIDIDSPLVHQLKQIHPDHQIIDDVLATRPSFLNQFAAVVDLSRHTPDSFMRDLLVRNVPVVAVDREPRTYSTNAVMMDSVVGVTKLTRELALAGHRHFLAVESQNHPSIIEAIRATVKRFAEDSTVDSCFPREILAGMEFGATAAICDSAQSATEVLQILSKAGTSIPQRISVAAIGCIEGDAPCTGCYVPARQKAEAVAELLAQATPGRPATLWLTGARIERNTTSHADPNIEQLLPPPVLRFSSVSA